MDPATRTALIKLAQAMLVLESLVKSTISKDGQYGALEAIQNYEKSKESFYQHIEEFIRAID